MAKQKAFLDHARANISKLIGKDLACWCALDGKPCHGDVLIELAEQRAAMIMDSQS